MKRTVMTVFGLALLTSSISIQPLAQVRCSLTEANAPDLRGVRLGLSAEQLVALFPGSGKRREIKDALAKAKAADGETVYLTFDPAADAPKDRFPGVDSVSAGLNKGRVVEFAIIYVGPTWRSIDEWVGKLAETLKLPAAQDWVTGPSENPNKILKCNGIEIEAAIQGGGGSVRVRNTEYDKGADERKDAGDDKKRRDFKP